MTFTKDREYGVRNISPTKDTFNAKVIITKDVARYARQISAEIIRIATNSTMSNKSFDRRNKKYGI